MIADTLATTLLILGVALGLARPVADRLRLRPAEGLVAGAALSLIGAWGVAWAVFITGTPLGLLAHTRPRLAGLLLGFRGLRRLAAGSGRPRPHAGPADRHGLVRHLALVRQVPLRRRLDRRFVRALGARPFLPAPVAARPPFHRPYQLPARPPLGNVLTAVFMRMTAIDYAHYQVIMAVLCSLAYLPVALLALRFGGVPRRGWPPWSSC
jgi:hypothetical protein